MRNTLNRLGFKYIPQQDYDYWMKRYKGFILFIAIAKNNKILASITVGKLEICLPVIPDKHWIIEFDKDNEI